MGRLDQRLSRADRHFTVAIRRLTRLNVRSVEQPVNLDDGDDVYNYPWLYAVQAGTMNLTDAEAAKLATTCCAADSWCATISGARSNGKFRTQHAPGFPRRQIVEIEDATPPSTPSSI